MFKKYRSFVLVALFAGVSLAGVIELAEHVKRLRAAAEAAQPPKRQVAIIETTAYSPNGAKVRYINDPAAGLCAMMLDRGNGGTALMEVDCARIGLDPK